MAGCRVNGSPEGMRGLVIAAPSSGSGKTLVTLGLLRAMREKGIRTVSAKSGPDYIDPRFHEAASGQRSVNLDAFAMTPARIAGLVAALDGDLLIVEGAMGLFDGAPPDGRGSCADLASILRLPVVLTVDCGRMSHSVAPLVEGFARHRADVDIAAVILNNVGSARHETMLRKALCASGIPVAGSLVRDAGLVLPSRHLGLVQAGEHEALTGFIAHAARLVERSVDLDLFLDLARRPAGFEAGTGSGEGAGIPPPGQRTAIARDTAFSFTYPHMLDGWRQAGGELSFFSPLADEVPEPGCDAVFLPGGYPELHAGTLADAGRFHAAMRAFDGFVYGECGGYMTLGRYLTDADGRTWPMLDLLPLETSFRERRRQLGYRRLRPLAGTPWPFALTGHEFHYATTVSAGPGEALFLAKDAEGADLGATGLRQGRIMGSFVHVIDRAGA